MVTLSISMLLILQLKYMLNNANPVKLSVQILVCSAFLFLMIYLKSHQVWFPLIYFMLFMGGILIMFVILSSLMPNENMESPQKAVSTGLLALATFMVILSTSTNSGMKETSSEITAQMSMTLSMLILVMIFLILAYFTVFLSIMEKMKLPLKTQSCHK